MKFSVLLSVYIKERPQYLIESIDSILHQTIKPDEIVLVKDGPLTNELNSIISYYTEKFPLIFKIISLETNQGLGKALNEGLKHCSHELIARMDTDDIAKPNRFEKQIELFIKHPEIDVCSAWIEEFENTPNNIISIKKLPEYHTDIIKYAKHRCPINHPVVMYKKKSVLKVNGYTGFPEDYYLWVKLIMQGSIFYNIQESLLYFRFSNNMIKRRGGLSYAKFDFKSQLSFLKIGFLNVPTFIYNILIRMTIRLIPNKIRMIFYKKVLR